MWNITNVFQCPDRLLLLITRESAEMDVFGLTWMMECEKCGGDLPEQADLAGSEEAERPEPE